MADHLVACETFMPEGKAGFLLCHHHTAAQHRLDPAGFTSLALGEDVLMPVTAPLGDGAPTHLLPGSADQPLPRSEEHTSELQSLMRISYAVFCLKKKKQPTETTDSK